jgi:hypothetical protein
LYSESFSKGVMGGFGEGRFVVIMQPPLL